MKRHKQLATASVTLTMIVSLVGCGTSHASHSSHHRGSSTSAINKTNFINASSSNISDSIPINAHNTATKNSKLKLAASANTAEWEKTTLGFIDSLSNAKVRQLAQHQSTESLFISRERSVGVPQNTVLSHVRLVAFSSNRCPPVIVATVYKGNHGTSVAEQHLATYTQSGIVVQPTQPLFHRYLASANPGLRLGLFKSTPGAILQLTDTTGSENNAIELIGWDGSKWTEQWSMMILDSTLVQIQSINRFLVGRSPTEPWQLTRKNGQIVAQPQPPVTHIPYMIASPVRIHAGGKITLSGWVPPSVGRSLDLNWSSSSNPNLPPKQDIVPIKADGTFVYTTQVPSDGVCNEVSTILAHEGSSEVVLTVNLEVSISPKSHSQ